MEKYSSIFILDTNENSRNVLKSYLEEFDPEYEIKSYDNYSKALDEIKVCNNSPIVFVDIAFYDEHTNKILEELKLFTSKFVIMSSDCTTDNIIKAMRIGAKEFLPKPVLKSDVESVLKAFCNNSNTDNNSSTIITIYSNKGGIGKTTIAANLAVELARAAGNKVALVDLNLQLGDISTFLNLNPMFDVAYVIKNLINKEENSLLPYFDKYHDSNLYVLADPSYIEQSESITPQQIQTLFKGLKKIFPFIIVDMSSNIDDNSLKILDESDIILFTTIVNIPAIRNAQRCLNLFSSRHYPKEKIKIILNRYMENDEIQLKDIENTLGEKIYWKIPNNYFSIMESINRGVPVSEVNANSNIANNFRDFATKLSDDIIANTIAKYRGLY